MQIRSTCLTIRTAHISKMPAIRKAAQTTKASVSEKSTSSNEDTVSELPVLSPDGESTAETSESCSDSSISDDKDRSDTQTAVQDENGTSNQKR